MMKIQQKTESLPVIMRDTDNKKHSNLILEEVSVLIEKASKYDELVAVLSRIVAKQRRACIYEFFFCILI